MSTGITGGGGFCGEIRYAARGEPALALLCFSYGIGSAMA